MNRALPVSVLRDAHNVCASIYRMNAPHARYYGFEHNGKSVTDGEYIFGKDDNCCAGAPPYSNLIDLKTGKTVRVDGKDVV